MDLDYDPIPMLVIDDSNQKPVLILQWIIASAVADYLLITDYFDCH